MDSASDTGLRDDHRPLAGLSVLVTRTREQAGALITPLEELGAEVIAFPVIEVADPDDASALERAAQELSSYDWLVVTSTNGVDRFFARLPDTVAPSDALRGIKVAAVGSATARRLRERGVEPDLVPHEFRAEGLLESLQEAGIGRGTRVLIPRAHEARAVLPEGLRDLGAEVDAVDAYRLVCPNPDPEVLERLRLGSLDVVTFASGATAKHFVDLVASAGLDPATVMSSLVIASVGPVTTDGIHRLGFEAEIQARESTMQSLVDAIAERYEGGRVR